MKIKLVSVGPVKLKTIQIVHEFTNISLDECKNLIEKENAVFEIDQPDSEFDTVKKKFLECGTIIELVQISKSDNKPGLADIPPAKNEIPDKSELEKNEISNSINPILDADKPEEQKNYKVQIVYCKGNKLELIKLLRETSGMGLVECKQIADSLPSSFITRIFPHQQKNITEQFQKINAAILITEEKTEEASINVWIDSEKQIIDNSSTKFNYQIKLLQISHMKIDTIKLLMQLSGLGLSACKDLVDNLPSQIIASQVEFSKEQIQEMFNNILAKVDIKQIKSNIENKENLKKINNTPNTKDTKIEVMDNYFKSNEQNQNKHQNQFSITEEQNITAGIRAGIYAGIGATILVHFVIPFFNIPVSFLNIAIGIAIGFAMRKYGKFTENRFRRKAVLITLACIIIGPILNHLLFATIHNYSLVDTLFFLPILFLDFSNMIIMAFACVAAYFISVNVKKN